MKNLQFLFHRTFFANHLSLSLSLSPPPSVVRTSVHTEHPCHRSVSKYLTGLIRLHELADGSNLGYCTLRCGANQSTTFSGSACLPATAGSPCGAVSVRRPPTCRFKHPRSHIQPLPVHRFAQFTIIAKRSERGLVKFSDDLFPYHLWRAVGYVTTLLTKMREKKILTGSRIPDAIWQY